MPVKKDAEWWKNYRAQKKEESKAAEIVKDTLFEAVRKERRDTRVARVEPEVLAAHGIGEDRANGLPRSNYYGGGFDKEIQKMSGHAIQKILDHPAIKTPGREKK